MIAGDDNDYLAKVNSILRTIELTTYIIAPAITGQLFTFLGFGWTGMFIGAWNLISVCLEYLLLAKIYRTYPALAEKKDDVPEGNLESEIEAPEKSPPQHSLGFLEGLKEALDGWKIYMNHQVRNAGVGLACLYMTVLGFDNITYGRKFKNSIEDKSKFLFQGFA